MSSLPPAGGQLRPNAEEPKTVAGQLEPGFTKNDIDRRRGRADRRGGMETRRTNEADRRKETLQTTGAIGEKQPLHLQDDQGRLEPNPKANVTGVADSERVARALETGQPLGTAEIEHIGVPSRTEGHTLDRESGDVQAGIGEVGTEGTETTADRVEKPAVEVAAEAQASRDAVGHIGEVTDKPANPEMFASHRIGELGDVSGVTQAPSAGERGERRVATAERRGAKPASFPFDPANNRRSGIERRDPRSTR